MLQYFSTFNVVYLLCFASLFVYPLFIHLTAVYAFIRYLYIYLQLHVTSTHATDLQYTHFEPCLLLMIFTVVIVCFVSSYQIQISFAHWSQDK